MSQCILWAASDQPPRPRPQTLADSVTAAILAAADAARYGALATNIPEHEVDDLVQQTLLATWQQAQRGAFPTEPGAIRQYLFVAGRNAACTQLRRMRRLVLLGDVPDAVVDPLPWLEARSELRAMPKPAYLRSVLECLARGDTLDGAGMPRGTAAGYLRRLRAKHRRKARK